MIRPWNVLRFLLITVFLLTFFASCSSDKAYQVGPIGGTDTPLVEKKNTWRGGVIGAALGSPTEGKVTEISIRASKEAAKEGKPVAYLSLDGFQRLEVYPVGKVTRSNCRLVREQIFQEGRLFRDEVKEVCQ
jgi:hypothetical protein